MAGEESGGRPPVNLEALGRVFGGSLIWVALALLVIVGLIFASIRVGRVSGEEVGIKLSKVSGKVEIIEKSGVELYNGILSDFFVLDKTMQSIQMHGNPSATNPVARIGDSLKVKTVDGSDVYVDLTVQFKMIPALAAEVMKTSGPDEAFKEKWARDYVRSIARNFLGELTTEEFYDSAKRDAKRQLAEAEAREKLQPYGIRIDSLVIPSRPVFYAEYEEMIKKKKVADQTVLEEESKALAAQQKQETLRVEAENEKNVAVKEFQGEMDKRIIEAKAEAERAIKESDAYFTRTTIAADAELYENTKRATGIIAQKRSEAEGIEALKKALEGEGGRNMVKLEYAKRLKGVKIIGEPFTVESRTERFQHTGAAARPRVPAQP